MPANSRWDLIRLLKG